MNHQWTQGWRELELTYGEQAPHDGRGGEAGEHIVSAGKVREVGEGDGLAPALAPHEHLPALRLGRRRVRRVAGGDLHDPVFASKQKETKQVTLAKNNAVDNPTASCLSLVQDILLSMHVSKNAFWSYVAK